MCAVVSIRRNFPPPCVPMSIADNGVGINRSSTGAVVMKATRPLILSLPKNWLIHSINFWFFTQFFVVLPRISSPCLANPKASITAPCVPHTGPKSATKAIDIARLRHECGHNLRRLHIKRGKEELAADGKIGDILKLIATINWISLELVMRTPVAVYRGWSWRHPRACGGSVRHRGWGANRSVQYIDVRAAHRWHWQCYCPKFWNAELLPLYRLA